MPNVSRFVHEIDGVMIWVTRRVPHYNAVRGTSDARYGVIPRIYHAYSTLALGAIVVPDSII